MAFDINDWEITTLNGIKFAPVDYGQQRIKDVESTSETLEVLKRGLNFTATKVGYYDGTKFIHYMSSDGDAQLKWKQSINQVVKDTHYSVDLTRENGEAYVKYSLVLSTADNPTFTLYYGASSVTLSLISAGNTASVVGNVELITIPTGTIVNAMYTYNKNGTLYHENQSALIGGVVDAIAFGATNGYTYTTSSYAKILSK